MAFKKYFSALEIPTWGFDLKKFCNLVTNMRRAELVLKREAAENNKLNLLDILMQYISVIIVEVKL